jgi:hypothetical protein
VSGRLALVDGIHRLSPGTVSVLLRLLVDRELDLFDGTRFVKPDRYEAMKARLGVDDDGLARRRIYAVHPGTTSCGHPVGNTGALEMSVARGWGGVRRFPCQ